MKVGINCAGIGHQITPQFVASAAQAAERHGFSGFWVSEHVALFDKYSSQYPYDSDFSFADPTLAFLDPLITLAWAAAATKTIRLGTSILILPQRNPVILAKELATLDYLSGGRVSLGIGAGWAADEFKAVGVPFERRGARLDEYARAMRALWSDGGATFSGEFVNFEGTYIYPKPAQGQIPIFMGGDSDPVIKRVARMGDGWMPIGLKPDNAAEHIKKFRDLADEHGRDGKSLPVIMTVFLTQTSVEDLKRFGDAGVTEVIISGNFHLPADDSAGLENGIAELAAQFVEPLKSV